MSEALWSPRFVLGIAVCSTHAYRESPGQYQNVNDSWHPKRVDLLSWRMTIHVLGSIKGHRNGLIITCDIIVALYILQAGTLLSK